MLPTYNEIQEFTDRLNSPASATYKEIQEFTDWLNSPESELDRSPVVERVLARTEAPAPVTITDDEEGQGMRGKLLSSPDRFTFILAGNAIFTVINNKTGNRFTYKVSLAMNNRASYPPHFVKVLVGPDNGADYQFIGTIFNSLTFRHGRKSRISETAPSVMVFTWFWKRLMDGKMPDCVEVWHEGRCGACGRALTVPESIERGLGPICAVKSGHSSSYA